MAELPCNCLEGYYELDNTYDCKMCPKYCSGCINETQCISCTENRVLNKFSDKCECQHGFKEEKLGICKPCYKY